MAGLTVAHVLDGQHNVTLFERNDYLGGHTNTRSVPTSHNRTARVDTGFIVCNPKNYPNFYRLLGSLGVQLRDSDMSFGFYCEESGFGYVGPGMQEFMRIPENFIKPAFLAMALQHRRFNRCALKDHAAGSIQGMTLREYAGSVGCSKFFIEHYLLPLGAAIWSTSAEKMLDFPAASFITFFKNHGILELGQRTAWQTVVGGSAAYVDALRDRLRGKIRTSCRVEAVSRDQLGVALRFDGGNEERFDRVFMACHADEALALLADATDTERNLLGAWQYESNVTVLHTDRNLMPADRRLWASWNYRRCAECATERLAITYYMNQLQGLREEVDFFVSLNCEEQIRPETVLYKTTYTHPLYREGAIATQSALRAANGQRNTFYCGSYMGYGFHEDAVRSALDAAAALGGAL